jgi:catechol 2,3-dioxygenase-like lactoylglutathione lyase family enzyme
MEIAARLHHHAFVVRDQEATRRFYEDVVGLPLVTTWCEEEDFGDGPTAYCHTFYQLLVLHDIPTGAMAALRGSLDRVRAEGVTIVSELPPACTPIVRGKLVGPIDAYVTPS